MADKIQKINEGYMTTAPSDEEVAQAQAEAKVAEIATRNKFAKDLDEAGEFLQFSKAVEEMPPAITTDTIHEAMSRLLEYKKSKSNLDERIVENEQFFKLRHWEGKSNKIKPTAWLWNVILSKHADMMDGYPEANMLPKIADDVQEAKMLSSIIPALYEANGFKNVYDKCCWYKLIKGTAAYGIFWDALKQQGKGDITIEKVDILNLFWESGITDIQDSREVFHVALVDKEAVESQYPQAKGKLGQGEILNTKKYVYDDDVDTSDKVVVVDWYYKKIVNGKTILHYCKFVNDIVLYATENDTKMPSVLVINPYTNEPMISNSGVVAMKPTGLSPAERGLYDHGLFPFVFDPLFNVEGTPCGYSYIDICKHTQEDIDLLNHSIMNNAMLSSRPRYFVRGDGSINEKEFADFSKDIIHAEGSSVGQDSIRLVDVPQLPGNVITVLNNKIEELKETSGNRDVNNGSAGSSVTAASAIAALQESAGKTSRDNLANTYEAFKAVTYQVIELIRQFYNSSRQFRITGQNGQNEFVTYSNENIKPQDMGELYGTKLGFRVPQFDIEVSAQKATEYTKLSQNELALQFYQAGIFAPNNADQSLAVLNMMDFNHKEDVIATVSRNQTLMKINQQLLSIAMQLSAKYEPELAEGLAQTFSIGDYTMPVGNGEISQTETGSNPGDTRVANAREQTQQSTQVKQ